MVVAQRRVPPYEVGVSRARHQRRVERLVGRSSSDGVVALVGGLDLTHKRLEVRGALLRRQALDGVYSSELHHLARCEQIIDLLIGELGDDRAAVHLVANKVLTLEDPGCLAYRIPRHPELLS